MDKNGEVVTGAHFAKHKQAGTCVLCHQKGHLFKDCDLFKGKVTEPELGTVLGSNPAVLCRQAAEQAEPETRQETAVPEQGERQEQRQDLEQAQDFVTSPVPSLDPVPLPVAVSSLPEPSTSSQTVWRLGTSIPTDCSAKCFRTEALFARSGTTVQAVPDTATEASVKVLVSTDDRRLRPAVFNKYQKQAGLQCTIDICTNPDGKNSLCSKSCSDSLNTAFFGEVPQVNPHYSNIAPFMEHMLAHKLIDSNFECLLWLPWGVSHKKSEWAPLTKYFTLVKQLNGGVLSLFEKPPQFRTDQWGN